MNSLNQLCNFLSSKSKLFTWVFFTVFLSVGLLITKDYGIPWDEPFGRQNGIINAIYIAKKIKPSILEGKSYCQDCPALHNYSDADHGPFFELIPTFLEWLFNISDLQKAFHLRHLCIFLLFYISVIFFYKLIQIRFGNNWLSLLGALMLVASPRIFADAFFNAKDIPFLALTIISSYTLIRYLNNKTFWNAFYHGLACGMALDVRILGLLIPLFTVFFVLFEYLPVHKGPRSPVKALLTLVLFIAFFFGFTILFWPHLWVRPIPKFLDVLARSSAYPWTGTVLYLGEYASALNLPWHYLPVWIFISTPVIYSLFFIVGFVLILFRALRQHIHLYASEGERQDIILAGLFAANMGAVIYLELVLYDGWRHMFFMYGAFLYICVVGLKNTYSALVKVNKHQLILRISFSTIIFISVSATILWMIRNHPHQNVYFSVFNGPETRNKMELDYWGLSYKQGLEYILEHDPDPVIKIRVNYDPGVFNQFSFPPEQRKRLEIVTDIKTAKYYITEYRWHPGPYFWKDFESEEFEEVHAIKVDGATILSVFKLR